MDYEWLNPEETPKEWNRNTVADGKWLNKNTIVPLINRDDKLLELIKDYGVSLNDISAALIQEIEERQDADLNLYNYIKNILDRKIVGGIGIGVETDENNVTTISLTGSITADYIDVISTDPHVTVTTSTSAQSGIVYDIGLNDVPSESQITSALNYIVDSLNEVIDVVNTDVVHLTGISGTNGIEVVTSNSGVIISNSLDGYATEEYVKAATASVWNNTTAYISDINHSAVPTLWNEITAAIDDAYPKSADLWNETYEVVESNGEAWNEAYETVTAAISNSAEMTISGNEPLLVTNGAVTSYIDAVINETISETIDIASAISATTPASAIPNVGALTNYVDTQIAELSSDYVKKRDIYYNESTRSLVFDF